MNIIFFTRRFCPQIGGVEKHALMVGKNLIKLGHKVTVIAEGNNNEKSKEIDGISVKRIVSGENNWFKKFRIWRKLFEIKKLLKNADVIHCHDVFFWYLPFKIINPSKKVFTTFHGHETKFPPDKKAIIIRKISEHLSSGNICVGEYIKKWYHTKPNFVIYGGVNLVKNQKSFHSTGSEREIKNQKSNLTITFIGRLEKDLGIMSYLKSLDLLKKNKIPFDFKSYGEGPLASRIEKYGEVKEFVSDSTEAIEFADIVFCSSYLLMLEALIHKKIVISVYENKLKEDYLRNSPFANFVYICKDASEIYDVIKSVLDNPWKSEAMVNNGYLWAKDQTWEKVTKTYLELWKI
ncbi:MAG TPA: glycosyltransferase family 4 protein [Candidatus Limnocylindrales bacterium]|nr:glycosyltransferase family 4 protein [Candidatus Limnocylindrales bacterium]